MRMTNGRSSAGRWPTSLETLFTSHMLSATVLNMLPFGVVAMPMRPTSCAPAPMPNDIYGWGLINVLAAVQSKWGSN